MIHQTEHIQDTHIGSSLCPCYNLHVGSKRLQKIDIEGGFAFFHDGNDQFQRNGSEVFFVV